ncbi:MAG TPA: hypothetical protein VL442_09015 [Mucilaginibacter sp.]|nr:hypothetical protein [Mucilaginibacter sp.]
MLLLLIVATLILAIIGMVCYKRLTVPFRVLSWYLVFELFITLFDKWEIDNYRTNVIQHHIEAPGTYIFFGLIYYLLFKNKYIKKSILTSIVLVTIFSIINAFFIQKYSSLFPTYIMMLTEVLCVILAVMLFNKMLLYPTEVNIIRQSAFWFNTAVIIYNSSLFLASALGNYLAGHMKINYYVMAYFWFGTIFLFYIFLIIAILTDRRENINIYKAAK